MDGPVETNSKLRIAVLIFPMFIATLSLLTSIYNGYLNNKFVELIQFNVTRGEYMRTCKDIIDAYFQIKLKTSLLASNSGASVETREAEAANAVSHFAALGTYLANLQNEAARARYSRLSQELTKVVAAARTTTPVDIDKLFAPADEMFAGMNDDCIKTANSKL
jgi:hypothetical protein